MALITVSTTSTKKNKLGQHPEYYIKKTFQISKH